jgi:hypothetical protein
MADGYVATPIGPFATAVGAAFGTFTAKQNVSPIPHPVLLPFQLRPGSKIEIEAQGEYATTGAVTLALGLFCGAPGVNNIPAITTTFAESAAITTGTAVLWPWRLSYRGLVVAVGTSGSIVGEGVLDLGTSLLAYSSTPVPITAALRTVALNTTVANALGVCATYSVSAAGNTVRTNSMTAMLLN